MIRALWSSASGMAAQQTNIDVISNNLANVNTTGFKKESALFEDLMYQTEVPQGNKLGDGSTVPTGIQIGYGTRTVATARSFTQGDLQQTGGTLDVAIQGRGFFKIEMPDGSIAYTRDGSLKMNSSGQIVTNRGYKVSGTDTIDSQATDITIARDGTMSVVVNNTTQTLSPITLTDFPNPAGLRALGDNLYIETDASGTPQSGLTPGSNGEGTLAQGYLESSNVAIVDEMVRMIQAQRAYEISSKAIQASDEMLSTANNLKR
jgi:flagellar basal-body rod protein FlgG